MKKMEENQIRENIKNALEIIDDKSYKTESTEFIIEKSNDDTSIKTESLNIKDDEEPKQKLTRQNIITVIIVTFLVWLVMFVEVVMLPALYTIINDPKFRDDAEWVSWILSAYMVTGAVFIPLVSRLGDLYGKRKFLIICMIGYDIGLWGCGFSESMATLLIFRGVQGLGMAMFPLSFGIIRDTFPPHAIPIAMGVISSMFSIGVSAGFLGGGGIIAVTSWQNIFFCTAPLILILIPICYKIIPECPSHIKEKTKIDFIGVILLAIVILCLLIGMTQGTELGWTHPVVIGLIVTSIIVAPIFFYWEKRIKHPLLQIKLLTNRNLFSVQMTALFVGMAMFSQFQSLSLYLRSPKEHPFNALALESEFIVGLHLFPSTIPQLLFAPLAAVLSRKYGTGKVLTACIIYSVVVYGLFIKFHRNTLEVIVVLFFSGIGLGGIMVCLINSIVENAPKELFGIASGMNTLFRIIGGSIGPVLTYVIMDSYTALPQGPPNMPLTTEDGYMFVWTLVTILFVICIFLSLLNTEYLGLWKWINLKMNMNKNKNSNIKEDVNLDMS